MSPTHYISVANVFVRISTENRITIRITEIYIIPPEKQKIYPEQTRALSFRLCVLMLAAVAV